MMKNLEFARTKPVWLFMAAIALTSCGPNQAILDSANRATPPGANVSIERSSMEQDLEAMRTAEFTQVFVIRRKDGDVLDSEDRGVIRNNTNQANRRVTADEGKAVIIGTNTTIPPENMKPLRERFMIEEHSPPPPVNANVNS